MHRRGEFGGFDEWLGIPYSNDNGPLHPVTKGIPSLPLYDGEEVTEAEEAIELKERIERHHEYTGSQTAKEILTNWKANLPKFIKVMPRDFKRAMVEMKAEMGAKG